MQVPRRSILAFTVVAVIAMMVPAPFTQAQDKHKMTPRFGYPRACYTNPNAAAGKVYLIRNVYNPHC